MWGRLNRLAPVASLVANQAKVQVRHLNIHEYLSHELMKKHGIRTPKGGVADTPDQVAKLTADLGGEAVVKAQVLAGGRGKGHFDNGFQGGVHLVSSPEEAHEIATNMMGAKLITKQTGEEGLPCNKLLVVEKLKIIEEYYFAILMDRVTMGPVVVASSEGGMDIEGVAAETPELIISTPVSLEKGLSEEMALEIANKVGFPPQAKAAAAQEMLRLYNLFLEKDATMVEINPMGIDSYGDVICLDAKFNFDDNANYRQPDIFALRDTSQENPLEVTAHLHDLNYIGLDGDIGCLVNGAGLAMATMDIIQLFGGKPANFLDVGGGATAGQVESAFRLITSDENVTCIFVNIFGGIMRCDVIADGVIRATQTLNLQIPVVLRLQGTRVEEAKAMIAASPLDIISADDLDTAARKAVKISKIVKLAREENLGVSLRNIHSLAPLEDGDQYITID